MSKPDYAALIDAEMWDYIRRVDDFYPPEAASWGVAENRAAYDRMAEEMRAPRPARVVVSDRDFGGVPCRSYSVGGSVAATVVYYHGGGFCLGGLDSHDDVCAEICDRTGFDVVSVDYGLAPEVVFPRCFEDALSAFEAVSVDCSGPIVLAGDSAGGNLAAAVSGQARGRVAGQVLIYPGLGGDRAKGSYVEHAEAPHLTTQEIVTYGTIRTGGAPPPEDDERFAPLAATAFDGLPPSVIVTAACDPLASDGEAYRDALAHAGVAARWINVPGIVHGCLRARHVSQAAAGFFDEVVGAIDSLGQGRPI